MQSRRSGRAIQHATLAFVTNYPTRYGWRPQFHHRPDFFPGAVDRARELGYKLEHFWLGEPGMTPERFSEILVTRGVHGLLLGRMPPGQHTLELNWDRFSCVALGMTLRAPRLHHVTENHFDNVSQGMQQCLARGYRRVGFVFPEANDSPGVGDRWLGAYLIQQRNFPPDDRLPICPGAPTNQATFSEWFRRERPDALLVTHGTPILDWLRTLGKEVPKDVGLVALQDPPDFNAAGVYFDPANIGALAVEMLIGLMHRNETGVPQDQHEILLTGEWQDGATLPMKTA
jgi:LacI family transcriptional regulator